MITIIKIRFITNDISGTEQGYQCWVNKGIYIFQ